MEYKDFRYCPICRTVKNLHDYSGEFEITNLVVSLYFTVMRPIEKRGTEQSVHIKSRHVVRYLEEQGILCKCGNEFSNDDIVRCLRNGLAHSHLKINSNASEENKIDRVLIWAINSTLEDAEQYNEVDIEGAKGICKFEFKISEDKNQLKEFAEFMFAEAQKKIPDGLCRDCQYREELLNVNPDLR